MPIGFELDDEDDGAEPEPTVGSGCASLTDDGTAAIAAATRAIARLRRLGATFVRVGEMEAHFPRPPTQRRKRK